MDLYRVPLSAPPACSAPMRCGAGSSTGSKNIGEKAFSPKSDSTGLTTFKTPVPEYITPKYTSFFSGRKMGFRRNFSSGFV